MTKLVMIGPHTVMGQIIDKLYALKVLHVVDHKKREELDIGVPLGKAEPLAELLIKIRGIITALDIKKKLTEKDILKFKMKNHSVRTRKIKAELEKLSNSVGKNVDRLRETRNSIKNTKENLIKLSLLKNLGLSPSDTIKYNTLDSFIGYVTNVKGLDEDIKNVSHKYHLKKSVYDNKSVIALFIAKEDSEKAVAILAERGFSAVEMSGLNHAGESIDKAIKSKHEMKSSLVAEEKELIKKQEKLREGWKNQLLAYEAILSEESEKAEAPLKFASTEKTFMIKGWVPTSEKDKTINSLQKIADNMLYIKTEKVGNPDEIPVELENPKAVRPFQFFMDLYTLPKYRELDPTFFVFLSFPLFFGFMLGDMGYGVVTFLIFLWMKQKLPKAKNFFNILIYSSIATMFFGALFGELFGEEVIFGYHLPNILSRAHHTTELLYIAVAIGAIHVNIGLMIGFYNILKNHGLKHAILEKLSWIVLELGIVTALFYSAQIGVGIGLLSIIMIYLGEGVKGIIELPALFSNMLSYSRLMAIGLASVQLAMVVNEFAKEFIHKGGVHIIYAILILLTGHTINILLGLLGPFLHSLRLQYVEFFSKFFEGGGKRYVPFGYKE